MKIDIYTYPDSTDPKVLTAHRAAVMNHWVEGGEFEILNCRGDWIATGHPVWHPHCQYRAKRPSAQPTYEPWTFETAPKGCVLLRHVIHGKACDLVVAWTEDGLYVDATLVTYSELRSQGWLHSTDNGITWHLCGTLVTK